MAKRSFLRRVFDRITGREGRQPVQEPVAPPPPVELPESPRGGSVFDTRSYRTVYRGTVSDSVTRDVQRRTGYSEDEIIQAQLELFLSIPGAFEVPEDERLDAWQEYLEAFMYGSRPLKHSFLGEFGGESYFDWERYRESIGYSSRR